MIVSLLSAPRPNAACHLTTTSSSALANREEGRMPSQTSGRVYLTRRRLRDREETTNGFTPIQLPSELIAIILDNLRGKADALRASRLTCKAWANHLRPYIYETITLWNQQDHADLRALMEDKHLRPFLRELRVEERISSNEPWVTFPTYMTTLPESSTLLYPNLNTVELRQDAHWVIQYWQIWNWEFISTLVLRSCYSQERKLIWGLKGMRHLKSLQLIDVEFVVSDDLDSEVMNLPPPNEIMALETLVFALRPLTSSHTGHAPYAVTDLLPWFKTCRVVDTLRSVTLYMEEPRSPNPLEVGDFLRAIGGTLEELVLDFTRPARWNAFCKIHQRKYSQLYVTPNGLLSRAFTAIDPITLSHLTGLRRLSLGRPTHPAVMDILSSPMHSLQQLEFYTEFDTTREVSRPLFAPLDARICDDTDFPSLMKVRVEYGGPLEEAVVSQKVRRAFETTAAKGILSLILEAVDHE
ncbi:hypothetical protein EIP91_008070 [Steccherinum ochraceum]|uniref:F-box domain-containing protein n=1 Tax=Steccherinum ochraceum TaxID=92696 RepID=A0A4R0S0H1_9APHY|nr:hypothetical protein EIP91_008070 [Steccherinum ochraceum]